MSNQFFENSAVNKTETPCEGPFPGRCSLAQQWRLVCHPATARVRWNKEVNKIAIECV